MVVLALGSALALIRSSVTLVAFIMQETKEGHTCGSWKHDSVVRLFDLSVKIWGLSVPIANFYGTFGFLLM